MTKVKSRNLSNITGLSDVSFKGIMYKNEDILREVLIAFISTLSLSTGNAPIL